MQQALHIFKKDIRYLYREIIFLFALALLFGWWERGAARSTDASDALQVLYAVAVAYTIARLIHAEAIPGENQFWITRPYRWPSLLAAKLMFLIAFVQLPVFFMQALLLRIEGFPIATILGGLLWTQVLILLAISLPCFALAALTAGIVPFIAAILVLLLLGFVTSEYRFRELFGFAPESIEWLRYSIPFITAAVALPPVLYFQYKARRTRFSELLAGAVVLCGAFAFMYLPWSTLFTMQALLSNPSLHVEVKLNPDKSLDVLPDIANQLSISLHLLITGVPEGVREQIELYDPQLQIGRWGTIHLSPALLTLHRKPDHPNELTLSGALLPDRTFLGAFRREPATLRVSFFMTLFGNTRDKTIPFQTTPVNALDGLRCRDAYFDEIVCRAPFRWPARIVSVKYPWGSLASFTHLISYSPFPANLQLDPVAERSAGPHWSKDRRSSREVTIQTEEPIAYVRRDVEVPNFSLGGR
jgi:hypothetical protein